MARECQVKNETVAKLQSCPTRYAAIVILNEVKDLASIAIEAGCFASLNMTKSDRFMVIGV